VRKLLKDIKAFENYFNSRIEQGCAITSEDIDFFITKLKNIRSEYEKQEMLLTTSKAKYEGKLRYMQLRVTQAETREKSQIERQKQFGVSQTKVEDSRHIHIMEELKFMAENKITGYNRSSYLSLPRYNKNKFQKKDDIQKKK
jgi:hypothetical protein